VSRDIPGLVFVYSLVYCECMAVMSSLCAMCSCGLSNPHCYLVIGLLVSPSPTLPPYSLLFAFLFSLPVFAVLCSFVVNVELCVVLCQVPAFII